VRRTMQPPDKRRAQKEVYRKPQAPAVKTILTIERLAWGGKGVARSEDGKVILLSAPLALFPGEQVEAVVRWKPRHGEGEVTGWLKRDPRRVKALCPVAGACGGCELWEAGRETATLKRAMVADLLGRQLPENPDWRWLEAPEDAKRHRIQLHWTGNDLGYHRRNSHSVVPVKACPAAAPALSLAIPRFLEALEGRTLPSRPQRWELATGTPAGEVYAMDETGRTWNLEPDGWHPYAGAIVHRLGDAKLAHRAGGFFQVCPPWAWRAFGEILGAWKLPTGTLYDLYGGVGFFTALLGGRMARSVLVEFDAPAVEWARKNLEGTPTECVAEDTAVWLQEGLGAPGDLILLDPPRTGLAPEVCEKLQSAGAEALVLVGCDGAAFCRDVKRLAPAWKLEGLAVADLFPMTSHVECVGLLRRA
jgi:tRNA/tmRNA/rRNA uracil-C5-methylase (TrmA/RlmC/RlmD family)